MQSALVIGSNGFVGMQLVAELTSRCIRVQGVSRSQTDTAQTSVARKVPTYSPNEMLQRTDGFDVVFLLAAVIPYGDIDRVTPELIASNILLPAQVVERFPDARLVFASSVSVYGVPQETPITEEYPFLQPNAYGLSKAMGERMVAAHDNAAVLRFSSIYGAGMTAPTFIPRLISQGRDVGRLTLFGDGSRRQDYLHVDDAVGMLLTAAETDQPGVFNAVQGESASNREVATLVAELMEDTPIDYTGDDNSPSFEYSRTQWDEAFSYRPQVTLRDGLRRMLEDE